MNNSFLQMKKKKVFLNNLNVSYSFHISKVEIILIAWLHTFYTRKKRTISKIIEVWYRHFGGVTILNFEYLNIVNFKQHMNNSFLQRTKKGNLLISNYFGRFLYSMLQIKRIISFNSQEEAHVASLWLSPIIIWLLDQELYRKLEKITTQKNSAKTHQSFKETCLYIYIYIYLVLFKTVSVHFDSFPLLFHTFSLHFESILVHFEHVPVLF